MARKLKNPFLLTGYYGKRYFCDREEELETLRQHFQNERNVVLYAWRRMGKSALIHCFLEELESQKQAECIYVDLLGTRNMEDAVLQITKAVYQKYGKTKSGIVPAVMKLLGSVGIELSFDPHSGTPVLRMGVKRNESRAERSLEALGNFLQNRKQTVLVAIDEFQQIRHYGNQDGEAVFRAWVQAFPVVRFIFSGSHRNMMQSMFTEKSRPFYQSAQLLQLKSISIDKYKSFAAQHFKQNKQEITPDVFEKIYSWCRGQTYCIQLVCNRLYNTHPKIIFTHAEQVFQEILQEESAVFSNYTNLLTDTQWAVLIAVAKEEPLVSPMAKQFTDKYGLGASSSVSTALSKLMTTELVIKEDNHYLVHDVLLARWLQTI